MPHTTDYPTEHPTPRTGLLPRRPELEAMLRLALPVIVVQVGTMAMGVVDTVMVGHLSAAALAAAALGNLYFFAAAVFGMGVLMVLDPVVSQAVGAGDREGIARAVQRGLLMAGVLSVVSSLLLMPAAIVFTLLRQPSDVIGDAAAFARASIPGVLPFLVFVVLRQTLQAMQRMTPVVLTIVAANLANVALNWVLIYGHLGAPRLGVAGSALGSSIARWLMAGMLLAAAWRDLRPFVTPLRAEVLRLEPMRRMFRLGVPIGLQFQLEFGAFGVTTLLMGWIGTVQMAAHEVALNLASLTFMVPLGISAAAAVLVGQAVGRGDAGEARRAAAAALVCGVGFMAVSAAVLLLAAAQFARLYTGDVAVIAVAAVLIPIAGIFQVFDGLQVVSSGILRGVGDTRAPMMANIVGFWCIGMPVGAYLGFRTPAGPSGLWWGFVAGLATVGLFLAARVRVRLRRELRRVVIDGGEPALDAGF